MPPPPPRPPLPRPPPPPPPPPPPSSRHVDWTAFRNPSLYSFCSPGFLILVSVALDVGALVTACFVWCFDNEFREIVLEDNCQLRACLDFQSENSGSHNTSEIIEELIEQINSGCLDPLQGFGYVEEGIRLSFKLATKIGMDSLSQGEEGTKRKNRELFEAKKDARYGFFVGWSHHVVATVASIVLGLLFFALALLRPIPKCRKFNVIYAVLRNLIMLSGLIHYAIGYSGLSSIDKLELDYLFSDTKLFYVGFALSTFAFLADVSGSILTATHYRKERMQCDEDARPEMDRNALGATLAANKVMARKERGATGTGAALPATAATTGGQPSRVPPPRLPPPPPAAAASRDAPKRTELHDVLGAPKRRIPSGGGGGGAEANPLNRNVNMQAVESGWLRARTNIEERRQRRHRFCLSPQEAVDVDWKQFHRVVSGRDERGRRHMLYALPNAREEEASSTKPLTEEEADGVDWMKFHRIGGPRDPITGRRNCLYELPSSSSSSSHRDRRRATERNRLRILPENNLNKACILAILVLLACAGLSDAATDERAFGRAAHVRSARKERAVNPFLKPDHPRRPRNSGGGGCTEDMDACNQHEECCSHWCVGRPGRPEEEIYEFYEFGKWGLGQKCM